MFVEKMKNLKRFTTLQEKNFLLDERETLEVIENLTDIKPLNDLECLAMLVKLREISVSDVLEGSFECSCGTVNDFRVETSEILQYDDVDDSIEVGLFEEVDEIQNTDEMIISEINEIQQKMENNNKKILNLEIQRPCRKCGAQNPVMINPVKIMSTSTLGGIYDEYFNLSFYLHQGKSDIDLLYPFERELMLKMLKKKVEDPA